MTTLLITGELLTPFETVADGALLARDGVIEYVGPRSRLPDACAGVEVDAAGSLVCPGFVDLQVNGGGSVFLTDQPHLDAVERMTRAFARRGTTSLLPTVVTAPEETLTRALSAVASAVEAQPGGAHVLGAHLEGPFLSPIRKGAHDERFLRTPDLALLDRLLDAANGTLRILTVAPELPDALDLVARAVEAGAVASVGHSDATYDETNAGFAAGATFATHLYNGMRPLHHREPGIVGAALRSGWIVAGLIADGVHVDPALLDVAWRAKSTDAIALVTDAVATPGDPADQLQGRGLQVRDGACYLADGTLAGSALTMDRAVRLMRDSTPADLIECVRMATATPAAVLGLEDEIGVLAPGARADVVICDDDVNVSKVFVGGELAFDAERDN